MDIGFHGDGSKGILAGYTVTVAIPSDALILVDLSGLTQAGVKVPPRQRERCLLLDLETFAYGSRFTGYGS